MFYFFSDKRTISSFLAIYVASLLLNVFLFVPKFANAEPTISPNHLIAVVVDADLYDDLSLKKEIVWYARNYLQSQFSDSKALVLPLDKKNFKAKDIVKILENMYFEGVKDKTSDLVGIVLIGDMPLPVVKKNGFIFPSVFPYVDFRDQKYVYDEKSQFFEYNDKPYSVPEIWHGLIQLGSGTNAYLDYFEKLRKYAAQPAAFIDKAIWYDDFVELKKSFNSANLPYYIHNFLFSEDVGFHRFTNLIPDYFKGPSGDGVSALMTDLNSIDTQGTDPTSQMAAQYLTTMNAAASQMPATTSSQATPTLFLKKMVSELVKPYSENFGTLSLSRARDNILAGGRYKQFDSHLEKIVSKDALLLGNFGAEQDFTQPLTEISMKLEKALDDKIQQEKYFMKIPILTIYEKYKNRVQGSNFIACTFGELLLEGRYENFYFGKRASDVNSVQDLSIYRGSYKNFSSLDVLTGEDIISGSDVQTDSSLWSVGASYGLNDRQIEAHKGYNFDKSKDDIAVYNSRQDPNGLNECYQECQIRDQGSFTPAPPAECSSDYGSQSQVMAMDKFLWYYWGGVTPLNITGFDGNLSLKNFDYKYTRNPSVTSSPAGLAGGPIYDIAGAKLIGPSRTVSSLDGPLTVGGEVTTGYSYLGYKDFSSIQRIKLQYGYKTVNDPLDFLTLSFSSPGEEVVASYCFPQERIDGRIPYSDVEFFDIFKNKFPDNGEKVTIKVNGTSFNQTVRDDQCAQVSVLGGTITIGGNYKNTYEYDYKTFDTRNEMKAPTVAQITGMNLYTSDRPVDSVRYVNFQGIGGDLVKFVYPNLYNVEVFKRDGLVQTLKTPDEINSSIKDYLRKKVVLYNSSLTQQQAKRQNFYTQNQSAFDFLSVSDPLATPNRTYNLMPVDYFIDTLGEETISNAAYFLYYQNLGWSQKTSSTGVIDDLEAKKQSFDLNPKISHVMRYLQYGLNDGLSSGTIALRNAFYQSGGYELAYLNSDGFDYIQDESQVPSFIQRIQSAQARYDQDVAPRINDDLDLEIQKDRSECSLDADGSVSLDKWPEALKCWLKKTLKTQILTIDYKNSQGPVFVTDAIKALGSIFRGVDQNPQNLGSEIQDYALNIGKFSDQWSRIAQAKSDNENLLLSLSDVQKNKLQGIWDFINPRFMQKFDGLVPDLEVADNFYVEPVESYEQKKYFSLGLNAGSQDFGSVDISFSSTGNNCIVINSKNLCQQSYSLSDVDLFSQPLLLDLDLATKKAGLLMLDVKICDGQACIILPQTISIVPGAIDSISMVSPSSKILRGASLPFVVNAYDKRGNTISRVSDNYFVAVASGKNLYDGSFYSSFDVDSFENLYFLYDSSSLSGGNSSYDQISIQPSTSGFVNGLPANQKTIQLVDGTVRVSRGGVAVNQLSYKLPEAGSDLVSVDSQGLSQIAENNLVALSIDVKDLAGQGIYSQVSVKTKNALLKPGTVATGQVEQIVSGAIQSFVQETFVSHTNFLASNGTVTVYFYPSFQAGQDEIVISVPGSQDISIPVVVEPSSPKIVQVITDSDQMKIGSHQAALVVVKDIWMNQIIDPVDLQIGLIGSLSSSGSTLFSVPVQQGQTSFPFQGLAPGGKGYIYAYLKGVALENQKPGYKSLFVKNNFLPTDKLNVMYLNLFGADRGNMWGFFSDYSGVVTEMITRSEKLLAVTTMLVDPSHVRQTPFVIANNLTLDVSPDQRVFLEVSSSGFSYLIDGVGRAALGSYSDYVFRSKPLLENVTLNDFLSNSVVYVPELTDDEIETNLLQGYKVVINGETYVDFSQNFLKPGVEILYSHEKILGHSLFDVSFEGKKIGSLLLSRDDTFIGDQKDNLVQIFDHSVYSVIDVFAEGSTNGMRGVGISLIDVVLAADSDTVSSIQDSIDPEKNIAFQAQYKNITAFSAGQPVGESSLAFGSEFVVNFGDPALKRIDSNDPITSTDFDGGIGKTIYSDSTKTIHLVKEIDFNADGQKDLAIIYNDGTVKFLKEYGGNVSSTDLGPALLIADGIEDLNVGDVDGNGYPDLLVKTPAQKLRVYRNNEGIFDVDGTNVCLDVPGGPQDLSQVYQIFFQDMDLDDKLDIITNDSDGSIKIFYGGSSSAGPHYLSTDSFGCDAGWKSRQAGAVKVVKNFSLKIIDGEKIYDNSLVRWAGLTEPLQPIDSNGVQANNPISHQLPSIGGPAQDPSMDFNNDGTVSADEIQQFSQNVASSSLMNAVGQFNVNSLVQSGASQLMKYVESPINQKPFYEAMSLDDVRYVPIKRLETNDAVEAYKIYKDLNGGILSQGDKVRVTFHLIGKQNTTLSLFDRIQGPWIIDVDDDGLMKSFDRGTTNSGSKMILTPGTDYEFMIDNLPIKQGEDVNFSYELEYQPTQTVRIDVKKIDTDIYPDIKIFLTDSCLKMFFEFIGHYQLNVRNYLENFINLQNIVKNHTDSLQNNSQQAQNNFMSGLNNSIAQQSLTNMPGISSVLEQFSLTNLFQNNGAASLNVSFGFLNDINEKIEAGLQKTLQGLCNGFKIGKNSCGGLPLPFNMAFLSPGDFNLFGCKLMPDKGLPAFFFPGTLVTPAGPIPFPWGLKSPMDSFYWAPGGQYPSMIRLYLSPTLTMGLGVALCLGPMKVGENIPQPFRNIAGNCIVVALSLPSNCGNDNGDSDANQIYDWQKDLSEIGVCKNIDEYDTNPSLSLGSQTKKQSPFDVVSPAPNNIGYNNSLPSNTVGGGLFMIDKQPVKRTSLRDADVTPVTLNGGKPATLKILAGDVKGLPKCIIQQWLDNQIKYIVNNMSSMTIAVYFPDFSQVAEGFDSLRLDNLKNLMDESKNEADIQINRKNNLEGKPAEKIMNWSKNNLIQQAQLTNRGNKVSNPFDAISRMFEEVPLVNMNTRDVTVTIPFIYSEDIVRYTAFLDNWIKRNEVILDNWLDLGANVLGLLGLDLYNATDKAALEQCKANFPESSIDRKICTKEISLAKLEGSQQGVLQCRLLSTDKKKQNSCLNEKISQSAKNINIPNKCANEPTDFSRQGCIDRFSNYVNYFTNTLGNAQQLMRVIKQNMKVLEQYKQFPLKLYDWIHIYDRYLTELTDILEGIVSHLNRWFDINARRFEQYVDTIILLVGIFKTWQAIIDFSTNRQSKCAKCKNDNYDSYACSLSMLCINLPVIPIPPIKIPNIYLDFSKMDLGMDVLLPKFNFVPSSIPLPRVPNLPEPPQVTIDLLTLNLGTIDLPFLDLPSVSIPDLPILPTPPNLPQLPSFLPSININLPTLPPPPKIPKITPSINISLKVLEFLGTIYCIMKGNIGLVGEKGVKSKIEQLTQRTWEVNPFDSLKITRNPTPLQGMDIRVDTFVNLRFNFDQVYAVIKSIADGVNQRTEKPGKILESKINEGSRNLNKFYQDQIQDPLQQNVDINITSFDYKPGKYDSDDLSFDYGALYESGKNDDYQTVKNTLKKELKILATKVEGQAQTNKLKALMDEVNYQSDVEPNREGVARVYQTLAEDVRTYQKNLSETNQTIKKSYDDFLNGLQKNKLVADHDEEKNYSAPLFTTKDKTLDLLNQPHPEKTYLELNAQMVSGYKAALSRYSAVQLSMDDGTYQKAKTYVSELDRDVHQALIAYGDQQAPLLAQGATTTSSTISSASSQSSFGIDLAQYVNGIFVPSTGLDQIPLSGGGFVTGVIDTFTNVVDSSVFVEQIAENNFLSDVNKDQKNDLVMRDSNNVYVKYADQNFNYGQNTFSSTFYGLPSLRDLEDLEDLVDDGYASFNGLSVKIYDQTWEVKNFAMKGQNADTLSFSWSHDGNNYGYVIRLVERVDVFHDKEQELNFVSPGLLDKNFVVVLPSLTGSDQARLLLPQELDKTISSLQADGEIISLKVFDSGLETVGVALEDLDRKRYYLQIAPLKPVYSNNGQLVRFEKNGPWSQQIVAGRQIAADDQGPILQANLFRIKTNQLVSQGYNLKGFINTAYDLNAVWSDNVAVEKSWIEYSGSLVASGQGGEISLTGLFFTGLQKRDYIFSAQDFAGNIEKQKVTLTIDSPMLSLTDVNFENGEFGSLVSKLSQDIDTGSVKYERLRNGVWKTLTGVDLGISRSLFSVKENQLFATGRVFDLGKDIVLYAQNGDEMVTIDGKTTQIIINPAYQLRLETRMSFESYYPTVQIFDKIDNKVIFIIQLQAKNLAGLNPLQILDNQYSLQPLSGQVYGPFDGGSCLKKTYGDCELYIGSQGSLYVPAPYHTQYHGTYGYQNNSTLYRITNLGGSQVLSITFDAKSLVGSGN